MFVAACGVLTLVALGADLRAGRIGAGRVSLVSFTLDPARVAIEGGESSDLYDVVCAHVERLTRFEAGDPRISFAFENPPSPRRGDTTSSEAPEERRAFPIYGPVAEAARDDLAKLLRRSELRALASAPDRNERLIETIARHGVTAAEVDATVDTATGTSTGTAIDAPTNDQTNGPSNGQTNAPTNGPTNVPPNALTNAPTNALTSAPSNGQFNAPTNGQANAPTKASTNGPPNALTNAPSNGQTNAPTNEQATAPTKASTNGPTNVPTNALSTAPTNALTSAPSNGQTNAPTNDQAIAPTKASTNGPTNASTNALSTAPTNVLTSAPSNGQTNAPTNGQANAPTKASTNGPTNALTSAPSNGQTNAPTNGLANAPTKASTNGQTNVPTNASSKAPSKAPTNGPTDAGTEAATDAETPAEKRPVIDAAATPDERRGTAPRGAEGATVNDRSAVTSGSSATAPASSRDGESHGSYDLLAARLGASGAIPITIAIISEGLPNGSFTDWGVWSGSVRVLRVRYERDPVFGLREPLTPPAHLVVDPGASALTIRTSTGARGGASYVAVITWSAIISLVLAWGLSTTLIALTWFNVERHRIASRRARGCCIACGHQRIALAHDAGR